MKYKNLALILVLIIILAGSAFAQKVIKKTVTKVVTPQIAPAEPPKTEATPEVVPDLPPPPPPPTYEVETLEEDKGVFGWGVNSEIGGKVLYGSILFGLRGDIVFPDPFTLGERLSLSEDAVEYKLGLGFVISDTFKSIPLYTDAIVYLKEGALFGMDPYIGGGFIVNIYGTGQVSGGLGSQIYTGVLADLGFGERTHINLGYGNYKVGSNISDSGIFISVAQPVRL